MKYHVIMEEPAITEIEQNARWWAEHYSSRQALVWYDAAVDAIYSLESQPERHALSPENQEFDYEIRDLLFGIGSRPSYRAVFTIQGNAVHVLTVRRAAQDAIAPDDLRFDPRER